MRVRVQTLHGKAFWRAGIQFGPSPKLLHVGAGRPPKGYTRITVAELEQIRTGTEEILLVETDFREVTPEEREAVARLPDAEAEAERLRDELRTLRLDLDEATAAARKADELVKELAEAVAQRDEALQAATGLAAELETVRGEAAKLQERVDDLAKDRRNLKATVGRRDEKIADLEATVGQLRDENAALTEVIEADDGGEGAGE